MTPTPQGLSFFPTGASLALGLALVAATGVLCWLAWQRSGFRRAIGGLELLRFVLVCLILLTLGQPELVETRPAEQHPTLVVMHDRSLSMQTQDVIGDDPGARPQSRAEAVEPLLREAAWRGNDPDLEIVFEPFSSELNPPESGTDLNAALARVLERHANLRGVVLLSDGDWNVGRPPVEAAARYRVKGVPVFTVGVGSETPLPDLEVASLDAPTFGVVNKPLRIPFVIRGSLGQARDLSVTLLVNGEAVGSKSVQIPAMGRVQQDIVWRPKDTGKYTLTLRVPRDPRDLIAENNELSAPLAIRREQLKVLVIESYPRWEYRYLRNALERDPGVAVSCLLFHPDLPKRGGGRSYLREFPPANELSRFDVVFLGDVGERSGQLTPEQARALKQHVSAQAAGLVFLPGRYGWQDTLTRGALADLYPMVMDTARPEGHGSPTPGHFALTQAGQRSLLTRLADTDQENLEIWSRLPGFYWYAAALRAKAGAEVLAVHGDAGTEFGRVPLIVTKTYGTGKVLFMGTDGAWRWREGVEDKYHYRFWGQVARWMAYQRQMAQGRSMRLFYSPDRPRVDDVVSLNANVLDAQGGPLSEGTVVVQSISPSGHTQTIRLQPGRAEAWGLFTGTFTPREPGAYRLVATCGETGASVEADLSVQGLDRERQGRLARFDVLEEIATITRGRLTRVADVDQLREHLATLPEPEPTVRRTRLWSHPAWGGFLIFLMGVFWVGRKLTGTI